MKTYFTVLQSVYKKDNPIFLSQSLQSIAENTVQPYSVVLVKDGILNHELESVISEWQSKLPLKVVGYEKNQGLAYALNYGFSLLKRSLLQEWIAMTSVFQTDLKNILPSLKYILQLKF